MTDVYSSSCCVGNRLKGARTEAWRPRGRTQMRDAGGCDQGGCCGGGKRLVIFWIHFAGRMGFPDGGDVGVIEDRSQIWVGFHETARVGSMLMMTAPFPPGLVSSSHPHLASKPVSIPTQSR